MEKKSRVAYEIPCCCWKVYIGETKRTLQTKMKEHRAAARLGHLEKSVSSSRTCLAGGTYNIDWSDVRVLDEAPKNSVLLIKEALHIRMKPTEEYQYRPGLGCP